MLDWEELVNKIHEDINPYCEHNDINLVECLKYLKSFIGLDGCKEDEGLRESFIPNLSKLYDSSVDIHDKRNCIYRLTLYEPFLRKICYMKDPENMAEIKNLSASPLLKKLNLIENDLDLENKDKNYYSEDSFIYHLIIMYKSKNDTSHRYEKLNEREISNMRWTISIFYIEVVSRFQNIFRKVSCFPDETIEYYARYVDRNGIPHGIRKISLEQVKKRNDSYKFIIKNKRVVKVIHINSFENPVSSSGSFEDPVIQEISYLSDNNIKIYCTNTLGRVEYIKDYKKINGVFNRVDLYKGSESCSFHVLSNSFEKDSFNPFDLEKAKAAISGYMFERNSDGFITKKTNLRFHGENYKQQDSNGIFGEEYVLDSKGKICKKIFLGENGKRIQKGIQWEEFLYDENEECTEHILFQNGEIKCREKNKYDEVGNLIENVTYDCNSKKLFITKFKYNRLGQQVEIRSLDGNKNPIFLQNLAPITLFTYDENGYIRSQSFYDDSRNPIIYKKQDKIDIAFFHKVCYERDENDLIKRVSYFDIDNKIIDRGDGTSIITHKYDENGNIIEDSYFDNKGNLTNDKNGVVYCKNFYDEENLLIKQMFFDKEHNPTRTADGYFSIKFKYYKGDEADNIQEICFIDSKKRLADTIYGYAKIRRVYNRMGLLTDQYFYDKNDRLSELEGCAHIQYKYDNFGNLIQKSYFNLKDKLTSVPLGWKKHAILKIQKSDKEIIETLFDENENPLFQRHTSLDEYGNEIKITNYEYESTKTHFKECINQTFDINGNIIEKFYTDENENVIQDDDGNFITKIEYDNRGYISCIKNYNAEYELIMSNGKKYAYTTYKNDYMGNIMEEFFYDTNNKPFLKEYDNCFGWTTKYDSLGRPINRYYLDINKKKICLRNGIFCLQIKYNDINDDVVSIRYLNKDFKILREFNGSYKKETTELGTIYIFDCSPIKDFKMLARNEEPNSYFHRSKKTI